MKLSDLVAGCGGAALSVSVLWGKSAVTLRLVPEGVQADLRASVAAPVPPEDQSNAALMGIFHAECMADRARMELLEIAAAAGIEADVEVSRVEDGVKKSRVKPLTAQAAADEEASGAAGTVCGWVEAVLPGLMAMTEPDLKAVREAYRGLVKTVPNATAGVIESAAKKS